MKNFIISIIFLSFMAFSITSLVHAQTKTTNKNNLISIQFQITSINHGKYNAIPLKPNKDKPALYFNESDIKGKETVIQGQIVNAIYKQETGEDQFLYITPTNKYSFVYKIISTHSDFVTVINPNYPNEQIEFYYDDMKHKQVLNVNDQIAAFFYKDKSGNFHIIDWNKTVNN